MSARPARACRTSANDSTSTMMRLPTRGVGLRFAAGGSDGHGRVCEERQMIILDEDAVAQRPAVIRASAEEDGPFLKRSQARDRLSRIQDRHRISANCVAEASR